MLVSAVEMHWLEVQPRSQTARPLGGTVCCRSPGQLLSSDGLMLMTRTHPSAVVGASTARERRAAASMSGRASGHENSESLL